MRNTSVSLNKLLFLLSLIPALAFGGTATNSQGFLVVTNPPPPIPKVSLAWDAPIPATGVIGYKIYYGASASGQYTNFVDVGNVLTTSLNLTYGSTFFFAATAYTTNLESAFSNEVSYNTGVPPTPPGPPNLHNPIKLAVQEKSSLLDMWADTGLSFPMDATNKAGIFRLVVWKDPQPKPAPDFLIPK